MWARYSRSRSAIGVVYAGGRAGAFRSADRGDTWQQIRPAELAGNAYSFCLSGNDLYVGTDDGLWHAGSGLPGEAWIRAGLDHLRVVTVIEIASGHLMAGTLGAGVWSRPGADEAWHRCGGLDAPLAFDLIRSPSTGEMLVGGGTIVDGLKAGGVYRSADGERWESAELEPNTVYDVVELSSGVILAGAQRSKILRSDDGARTFVTTRPNGRAESKMYSLSRGVGDAVYLGQEQSCCVVTTPETRGKLSAAAWTASPCMASLRSRTGRCSPPRPRASTAAPTTPTAGARSTGTRESRTASHDDERLGDRGRDAVAVR